MAVKSEKELSTRHRSKDSLPSGQAVNSANNNPESLQIRDALLVAAADALNGEKSAPRSAKEAIQVIDKIKKEGSAVRAKLEDRLTTDIKGRMPLHSHTLWFTHSVNLTVNFSGRVLDLDIPMPDFTSLPGFAEGLDAQVTLSSVLANALIEKSTLLEAPHSSDGSRATITVLSNPRLFSSLSRAQAFYDSDVIDEEVNDIEAFRFYLNSSIDKILMDQSDPSAAKIIEESRNRKGQRGFSVERSIVIHDGQTEFSRSAPFSINDDAPVDANGEIVDFVQKSGILSIHPQFRPKISKTLSVALVTDREVNETVVLHSSSLPPVLLNDFSERPEWLDYVEQQNEIIARSQDLIESSVFEAIQSNRPLPKNLFNQESTLTAGPATLTEVSPFLVTIVDQKSSFDPDLFASSSGRFSLPSPAVQYFFSVGDLLENVSGRVFSASKKSFRSGLPGSSVYATAMLHDLHRFFEPFSRGGPAALSLHKKYLASRTLFFKNFFKGFILTPVLEYESPPGLNSEVVWIGEPPVHENEKAEPLPIDAVLAAINTASKIMDDVAIPSYQADQEWDDLASITHASLSKLCAVIDSDFTPWELTDATADVSRFRDALAENAVFIPPGSRLDFILMSAVQKQEEAATALAQAEKWAPLGESLGVEVVFSPRSELLRDPFATEIAKLNPPQPLTDALLEWLGRRNAFSAVNAQAEAVRAANQSRVLLPLLSALSKLIETAEESAKSVGGIFSKLSFRPDGHLADRLTDSFLDFQSAFKAYKDDTERSIAADKIWLDHAALPASSFAALSRKWSEWITDQTKTPLPPLAESKPSDIACRRRLSLSSSILDALTQSTTASTLLANEVTRSLAAREELLKKMLMVNWGALGGFAAVIQTGKLAGLSHAQEGILESASSASSVATLKAISSDEVSRQNVRDAFMEMTQSKDTMASFHETLKRFGGGVLEGMAPPAGLIDSDLGSLSDLAVNLPGPAKKAEEKRGRFQAAHPSNSENKR